MSPPHLPAGLPRRAPLQDAMAPPLVGSLVMGMRHVFPQQMSEVAFSQRRIHAQPDPRWRVFLLLAGSRQRYVGSGMSLSPECRRAPGRRGLTPRPRAPRGSVWRTQTRSSQRESPPGFAGEAPKV